MYKRQDFLLESGILNFFQCHLCRILLRLLLGITGAGTCRYPFDAEDVYKRQVMIPSLFIQLPFASVLTVLNLETERGEFIADFVGCSPIFVGFCL